jgi:hypothetical protein
MQRLLRVKEDLQGIVVTAEYARQKFSTSGRREEDLQDGEVLDRDIGSTVRAILLDEEAFWKPLIVILHVAMPLIKLLRGLDGNQPMMGKVYMRMFQIGERIAALQEKGVPWAASMKRIHEDRWEYIHSDFHSAGYALDPEFIECVGDLDGPTQDGVLFVIQRMCLRDAMVANEHKELTLSSPEVVERVAQAEREFSVYQEQKGAFVSEKARESANKNAEKMEPASWWSIMYGRHLPIWSSIASRVLAQPASSSAAERNCSVYGRIHSAQKARMKHGTAQTSWSIATRRFTSIRSW